MPPNNEKNMEIATYVRIYVAEIALTWNFIHKIYMYVTIIIIYTYYVVVRIPMHT